MAREEDLPAGHRLIVDVGGRSVGVFNVGGRLFAVRNRCPHQGGPLCLGNVVGGLEASAPGAYVYRPDEVRVECPWHGWEFDVATGRSWFDPRGTRVRPYAVGVEAGCPEDASVSPGLAPAHEPQQAEVYEVDILDRYVVVEVA